LKVGDALSPVLFNFVLEYAIRRVQANQEGLKLSSTLQLLVYPDVNILGGNLHIIKQNTGALLVDSKEIGLEVNVDRTKYMVMSRDQNAGRSRNINTERAEEFKYLGTDFTYRNLIEDETQSRLKSELVCCHSVQNILSSSLLSKNTFYLAVCYPEIHFIFQFAIQKYIVSSRLLSRNTIYLPVCYTKI
jgi:hypothetical protein